MKLQLKHRDKNGGKHFKWGRFTMHPSSSSRYAGCYDLKYSDQYIKFNLSFLSCVRLARSIIRNSDNIYVQLKEDGFNNMHRIANLLAHGWLPTEYKKSRGFAILNAGKFHNEIIFKDATIEVPQIFFTRF